MNRVTTCMDAFSWCEATLPGTSPSRKKNSYLFTNYKLNASKFWQNLLGFAIELNFEGLILTDVHFMVTIHAHRAVPSGCRLKTSRLHFFHRNRQPLFPQSKKIFECQHGILPDASSLEFPNGKMRLWHVTLSRGKAARVQPVISIICISPHFYRTLSKNPCRTRLS